MPKVSGSKPKIDILFGEYEDDSTRERRTTFRMTN